ncbi:UNVERIFIED_CONTAM: hypothetical protein FKN15_007169 [Acipenser sinensis]
MSSNCQQRKSCPIPTRVVHVKDWTQLPDRYSSTPGGTLFSTTPGGPVQPHLLPAVMGYMPSLPRTRIIYERKFLLECRNSPLARTPPCCLPQIPGVTVPQHPPLSKLEELKEEEPDKDLPGAFNPRLHTASFTVHFHRRLPEGTGSPGHVLRQWKPCLYAWEDFQNDLRGLQCRAS